MSRVRSVAKSFMLEPPSCGSREADKGLLPQMDADKRRLEATSPASDAPSCTWFSASAAKRQGRHRRQRGCRSSSASAR